MERPRVLTPITICLESLIVMTLNTQDLAELSELSICGNSDHEKLGVFRLVDSIRRDHRVRVALTLIVFIAIQPGAHNVIKRVHARLKQ